MAVGPDDTRAEVLDRDRERFVPLLGASFIAAATGVLTSTVGERGPVWVWELGKQGLVPSEHGALILEPNDAVGQPAEYVPGFPLPQLA